jgi:hypothetical protein
MDDELNLAYILSTVTAIILLFSPFKTGVILLPCFFISLALSIGKVRGAQLVWLGIVGYFVYLSLTGVIGANGAYKLYYVATIPTSAVSLFCGYTSLDMTRFSFKFLEKGLRIVLSAYFVCFAILILGKVYVNLLMDLNYSSSISPGNIAITAIVLLIDLFVLIIPCALISYHILKESEYGLKSAPLLLVMSSLFFIDRHQKYVIENISFNFLFDTKDPSGYAIFTSLGYYLLYALFAITLVLLFLFLRNTRERKPSEPNECVGTKQELQGGYRNGEPHNNK